MSDPQKNQRGPYRDSSAAVRALGVEVTLPHVAVCAQLVDVSIGGVGLKVPIQNDPHITGGQVVDLHITGSLRSEIVTPARMLRSCQDQEGFVHYAFQFIDIGNLQEQIDPFYQRYFNRREHERVRPRFDDRVHVDVFGEDGTEFQGALYDISVGGLGIATKLGVAPDLALETLLTVKFELPLAPVEMVGPANVCSIKKEKTYRLIGMRFQSMGQDTEVFEREVQAYIKDREAELTRWARTLV